MIYNSIVIRSRPLRTIRGIFQLTVGPLHNWRHLASTTTICPHPFSTSSFNMATRRSARLSASVAVPKVTGPVSTSATSKKRKAATTKIASQDEPEATPSTPRRRRLLKPEKDTLAPPETPTPAAVNLIAEPAASTPITNTPKPKAITCLADPNQTNAVLLSPQTSRIVTSTATVTDTTSSSSPSNQPTSDSLLSTALAHLIKIDPRMKPLIEAHHCHIFSPEGLSEKIDPFESLSSGIISQQVSGAAAKAIKKRFIALFHPNSQETDGELTTSIPSARFPTPSQIMAQSIETLRTAGLSQRKAEYLKGLAEKFVSGELSAQMLADATYEEVLEKLIQVRGLGKWSVEMFACFGLKRMDIFSLGDLGVQRGMAAFVGRDVSKLKSKGGKWKYMSEKEMEEISDRFKPYRSLFMWYMWRVEETDISTME
ncbi:putative DNA-3-methyladenine glycosylase [Podospora fimiseda]|uniref:DNA-3-methyladenine glycosylase n=1 Tax=Podospora fimiseda TaxID=252190 RepID=A0AAN7BK34_9PEZI|nr:putative DNA-3-methyladenine glycosylase [Podospora fimiseda]